MNPRLQNYLEKRAGIWNVVGEGLSMIPKALGRAAGGVVKAPFRAAGAAGSHALGSAAGVVERGASKDPMGFLMAAGIGLPSLGMIGNPFKDPETMARGYDAQRVIAEGAFKGASMKIASSVLSQSDLTSALRIRGVLEKTASHGDVFEELAEAAIKGMKRTGAAGMDVPKTRGVRAGLGNMASEVANEARHAADADRKAELHPHQLEKLKAELQKFIGEAQGHGRAAEKHPLELENLRLQTGSREAREAEKARREAAASEQMLAFGKSREKRESEQHAKEMKRWSPGQLMLAGLGLGGAATVVGAGSHLMGQAAGFAQEKIHGATSDRRYNSMVKADPSLKTHPQAKTYFQILDRASPYLASEPYLAAATVQQMISTPSLHDNGVPAVQPKMLQEILKTEQARQETRFPFLNKKDTNLRDIATLGG